VADQRGIDRLAGGGIPAPQHPVVTAGNDQGAAILDGVPSPWPSRPATVRRSTPAVSSWERSCHDICGAAVHGEQLQPPSSVAATSAASRHRSPRRTCRCRGRRQPRPSRCSRRCVDAIRDRPAQLRVGEVLQVDLHR
jgi:hypothetical protein